MTLALLALLSLAALAVLAVIAVIAAFVFLERDADDDPTEQVPFADWLATAESRRR